MPPKANTGAGTSGKKGANAALTKPIPSELIAPFAPNNNTAALLGLPDGSGLPYVVNSASNTASNISSTAGGATISSLSASGNAPTSSSSATTASGSSSSAAGILTGATLVPPTPAAPTSTMFDFAANSANFHHNNPNSPDGLVNFTLASLKDAITEHLKSLTAAQRELAISEFYKVAIALSFAHLPSTPNASSSPISSVIGGGADLSAGLLGVVSDTVTGFPSSSSGAASGSRGGGGGSRLLYEIAKAIGMSEDDCYTLSRNALASFCNSGNSLPATQPVVVPSSQQAAPQPPSSATTQQPATGAQHIHPLFNKMTYLTFNALAKPVRALAEFHNKQLVHRQAFLHLQKSRVKANCIRVRVGCEGGDDGHNTGDKKSGKGEAQGDNSFSYPSPSSDAAAPSPSRPASSSSATQLILTGSLAAPLVAHINQQELREKARCQQTAATATIALLRSAGGSGGGAAVKSPPLSSAAMSLPAPTLIPQCILPMTQTRSLVAVNAAKGEVSLAVPVLPAIDDDLVVVHHDIRSKDSLQESPNNSAAVARVLINNQKASNLLLSSALYSESSVDDLAEAITSQLVDALFYPPHAPNLLQPQSQMPKNPNMSIPHQKLPENDLPTRGSSLTFSMLASALPSLGHTNNESALLSTATGLAVAAASLPSQIVHYAAATQSQQQQPSGTNNISAPFPPSVPSVSMSGANATLAAMCLHGGAAMPQQQAATTSSVSPGMGVSAGNIAAVEETSSFSSSSAFTISSVLPSSNVYVSALGIPAQISHSSNSSSLLSFSQPQQGGGGAAASLLPPMTVPPPPPGLGVVSDAFGKLASVQSLCSSAHIVQGLQHHGYSLALAEQLRHVITNGGRMNFFGGGYGEIQQSSASQLNTTSSYTCTHGGIKGLATALQNTNNTEMNLNEINSAASAPAVRLLANDHSRRYTLMVCRGSLLAPSEEETSSSSPYTSHAAGGGGGGASSSFSTSRGAVDFNRGATTASPSFNRGAASPTSQQMPIKSSSTAGAGAGGGGGNFEGKKRPLGRQQHKREQIYCIGLLEGEEQIIGIDLKRNDPFATAEMKSAAAADLEAKPRLLQSLISKNNPYRLVLGGVAPSKALQRHKELVAAAAAHSVSYSSPAPALNNATTTGGRRKGAVVGESYINGDSEEEEDMLIEEEGREREENENGERSKTDLSRHSPTIVGGGRGKTSRLSPSRARSPRAARSSASPSALSQKQATASPYNNRNNNNTSGTGKAGPNVAKSFIIDSAAAAPAVSYDDDDAFPAESDAESEVTFLSIAVGSSHCLICVLDKTNNQTYVYGRGSTVAGALGPQRPIEANGPAASSVGITASLSTGLSLAANVTTPTKASTLFKGLKGLPSGEKEYVEKDRASPSPQQQQQSHLLSSSAVTKDRTKLFFRLGQEVAAARALEMQQHHQQEQTSSLLFGDLSSPPGSNGSKKTHTQNADEACWRSESITFAPIGCLCEKGIRSVYAGGDFTLAASSEGLYGVGTLHNISLTCGSPALLLPLRAEDVVVDVCIGSEKAYVLLEGNRLFCLDGNRNNKNNNKFEDVTETVLGPMLRYERTMYEKALCAYQQIAIATTTTATSSCLDIDNDGFDDNLEKAPTAESMLERLRRGTRPQRTVVCGGPRRVVHGGSNRRPDYAGLNDDYGECSDEEEDGAEEDNDYNYDNDDNQGREYYYYNDQSATLELSARAPTAAGMAADSNNPTTTKEEGRSSTIDDDVDEFANFISTDADLPLYANMSVIGSDVDPRDPYGAFTTTNPRDQSITSLSVPDPLIGTPLRFGLGIGGSRARIVENTENEMCNKMVIAARAQAEEKSKLESHRQSPAGKAPHRGTSTTHTVSPLAPTTTTSPTPAPRASSIPVGSKQSQRTAPNNSSSAAADKNSKKGGGTNNVTIAVAKGPGASTTKNTNVSPSSSATPPSGGGGGTTATRRVSDSAASITNDEKRSSASREVSAASATTGNTKSKRMKGHCGSEVDPLPRIWLKQRQNSSTKTLTPTHAYLSLANSSSSALGKVYGVGSAARAGGPTSPEGASPPPPPPVPIVLTSLKGGRDHWVVQDKHTSRLYGWGNNNFGQLGNEKDISGRLRWVCGGGREKGQQRSLHSATTPLCAADGGDLRSASSPSQQIRADKDNLATATTSYRHYAVPLAVDVMKAVGAIHQYLASTTLADLGSVAKIAEPLLLLTSSCTTEGNAQPPNSSSNSAVAITTTQQYPWSAFSSANASLASVLSLAGVSALSPHFPHAGLVKTNTAASIPSLLGDLQNTLQSCRDITLTTMTTAGQPSSTAKHNNNNNNNYRRPAPLPPSSLVHQSDVFDPFYRTLRYFIRELYETVPILLSANSSLSTALTGSSAGGGGGSSPLTTAAAKKGNANSGGAMAAPSRGGSANNSTNSSNNNNKNNAIGGGAASLSNVSTAADRERQRVLAALQGMSSAEVALFIADQPDVKGIFITPPPHPLLGATTSASVGGGTASKGTATIMSSPRGVVGVGSSTTQFSVQPSLEANSPLALSPMEAVDLPSGMMISSYVCLGWCTIVEISALVRDVSHVLIEGYRRKVTAELEARDARAEARIRETIGNASQGRILSVATAAAASTLPSLVAGSTQSSAGPNNANKSSSPSLSYSSTPDGDGSLTLGELNTRIGKIMGANSSASASASQAQPSGGGGGSIKPTGAVVTSPASGGPSYLKKPAVTKVEVVAPEMVPLEAVPPILRRVSILFVLGSTSAPLQ